MNRFLNAGLVYSSFLFSFLMPFSIKFANLLLIIFFVFSLLKYFFSKHIISNERVSALKFSTLLLLMPILVSLFLDIEFDLLLKATGRRVAFFLTPLAFLILSKQNTLIVKEGALKGLVFGVFASSVFLILNILHEYYLTRPLYSIDKDILNFYHTNYYFLRVLDIHPSYYGMFVILGIATVYFYKTFVSSFFNTLFIAVSLVVLLFINARVILFLFLALSIIFLIKWLYQRTNNLLKLFFYTGIVIALLGSVLFFVSKNTYAYQRVFKESLWEFNGGVGTNYNFSGKGDSRMARWHAAFNVIKRKPILGYGVFKEREVLQNEYIALNMISSFKSRYNAHNQFLGYTIEGGVLAAFALFMFVLYNFYISIRNADLLFFLFTLSLLSICLIENYLVRNAGIIFIAFFSSAFLFNQIKE